MMLFVVEGLRSPPSVYMYLFTGQHLLAALRPSTGTFSELAPR
jgi:hypothetical protein